jgi:predicted RNase H-like nuclease
MDAGTGPGREREPESGAGSGLYVGVDWSVDSGAWLALAFGPGGFDHAAVFDEVGELWLRYEGAERVLLDVPIGLVDEGEAERAPEALAREVLGERSAAVVTPPVREATRKRRYPAATRVNERLTGRGLSERAFARSEAIAAVDELLRGVPEARPVVAESHPEVCFRALAGEPMAASPRTAAGYAERLRTLAEFDRDAPRVVQSAAEATAGCDAPVAVADVLDAAALAYTARPGPGRLRSLPLEPETDAQGLPVRMLYRAPEPLPADAE